jgi:DMSO/TMAO reductase YedYZ molybdopterin-dependent catalytic subunit
MASRTGRQLTDMDDSDQAQQEATPGRKRSERAWAALAGMVAVGAALGVSALLAGLSRRIPSLVVSVGDIIVDHTPLTLVRASIQVFGTNDKPALLIGIVVTALLIGGLLGVLAASRRWVGVAGFIVFAVLGAWAGSRDPLVSDVAAVVAAAVAGATGIAVLFWLLGAAEAAASAEDEQAYAEDRRRFLTAAAAIGILAAVGAVAGRMLGARSIVEAARSGVELTSGAGTAETVAAGLSTAEFPGLSPLYTPNEIFYRIDTALVTPQVDPVGWKLRFTGMVDNPYELTFDELLALPMVEQSITLACVSNEVGGRLVGNARWLGVPLRDLLDEAGVQPGATQIVGRSVDDFTVGFPTAALDGDRPALVAVGMNGEPLPAAHGFPARLVVSGLYGYVSATKWLTEVELTTLEDFDAYWIPRGWAKEAPIKTQSRIDTPRDGRPVAPGTVAIAGVAWAQSRDIVGVEVQVDDRPWVEARLGDRISEHAWRQWVYPWEAEPGTYRVRVRATDGTGETQTEEVQSPRPDGATGYHTVTVVVATA